MEIMSVNGQATNGMDKSEVAQMIKDSSTIVGPLPCRSAPHSALCS